MFDRYTEQARRVIFFARYEAATFGSDHIEPEHFLLGLFRESLTLRTMMSDSARRRIRHEIEKATPIREQSSTTVDLPLSASSKRVLGYAAEEAERLGQSRVLPEHLALGLLREPEGLAARLVAAQGVTPERLQEVLAAKSVPRPDNEAIMQSLTASFEQVARKLTPEVEPATVFRLR